VKRSEENSCYPSKISVFLSFLPCLGELKYHWLKSRKGQKTVKIMFDEECLNPHGVGNLTHNKNTSHPHLESEKELSAHITDLFLGKFKLSREQLKLY